MRTKKSPRQSAIAKLHRKQFKIARRQPRTRSSTPDARKYKRSIFDTTTEQTMMEQGDASSFGYNGLQLAANRPVSAVDKNKFGRTTIYYRYIKKLVKHLFPNHEKLVSSSGKITLNDFSNQMFELITDLASDLIKKTQRQTLSHWDLQAAVRIVLPKGLALDANAFACKKLENLRQSRSS